MFDIGFWELILISFVALVVLGPEKLPVAIRSFSKFVRAAKSMSNNLKDELSQELKIQELQDAVKKMENFDASKMPSDMRTSIDELKRSAQDLKSQVETTDKPIEQPVDNTVPKNQNRESSEIENTDSAEAQLEQKSAESNPNPVNATESISKS